MKLHILFLAFLLSIFSIALVAPPTPVFAQCGGLTFPGSDLPVFGPANKCSQGSVGGLISGFLLPIISIAGFLTVIFIVISGIQFILSSGNPEAAAGARGRLMFALVGFALIILAFAILAIVNRLFLGPTGVA